jgi:hypothetical protein
MARQLWVLVTLAFGFIISDLNADPDSITWAGLPVVTAAECGGCPVGYAPQATESTNGAEADLAQSFSSSSSFIGGFSKATISTPFQLSSAAEVEVSITSNDSFLGFCNTCVPGYTPTSEYGASEEILGPGGFLELTVGVGTSLNDASDIVELAAGQYTLLTSYSDGNTYETASSTGHVNVALTAPSSVPEPAYTGILGGLLAAIFIIRRFSRARVR